MNWNEFFKNSQSENSWENDVKEEKNVDTLSGTVPDATVEALPTLGPFPGDDHPGSVAGQIQLRCPLRDGRAAGAGNKDRIRSRRRILREDKGCH